MTITKQFLGYIHVKFGFIKDIKKYDRGKKRLITVKNLVRTKTSAKHTFIHIIRKLIKLLVNEFHIITP